MSIIDTLKSLFSPKLDSYSNDGEKEWEMVSIDVVYEPNVKDTHGNWMTKEEIEKAAANFNENLKSGVVKSNLFHVTETDKFTILDTWVHKELDVTVDGSEEKLKAGTWVAKVKYNCPHLWKLKCSGAIGGLSMGGHAYINEETGEMTDLTFSNELGGSDE